MFCYVWHQNGSVGKQSTTSMGLGLKGIFDQLEDEM